MTLGNDSFRFYSSYDRTLIMRSMYLIENDKLDLPELTTITTNIASVTFLYPRQVTLESTECHSVMMIRYSESSEYWSSSKNI